ncbi:ABC transporter ATP-binding protein [Nocardia lijiangensis]|uniref:ABC transporter ATP-binding protein n=1 Tax=Nocardia lijiangensis TaxID=299618 RepID=UPI00083185E7|nr:ABC transporter ATP-binding protein [Nocardia lijiangensis]
MAALLRVEELSLSLPAVGGLLRDVGFEVARGEVVGLVGESGSGKTLTGLGVLGLHPPGARVTGRIDFCGEDLLTATPDRLRALRGREVGMIFQEPRSSLNPVMTVGRQIANVLRAHEKMTSSQIGARTAELLEKVGLADSGRLIRSYPHELSGGMCQRVMIAMALACRPKLLIADEPTTALDVTIQAQILELLRGLTADEDLAVLLISHDIGVITELCDRVVTMYSGEVVDIAARDELLRRPAHPYAQALLQASSRETTPTVVRSARESPPDGNGCVYRTRCRYAIDACRTTHPDLIGDARSATRCLRAGDLELAGLVA